MNAVKPGAAAYGRIAEQVPAFAAIGVMGYFVDATITFVCAKYFGLSPELARPPGFISPRSSISSSTGRSPSGTPGRR
jgi:hypothetical protein